MAVLYDCIKSIIEKENKKYIIDEDSFNLAKDSHLLPFLYLASDDKTDSNLKEKIYGVFNSYVLYDALVLEEYKNITKVLNQNSIEYSILKGINLNKYYPETYLRYMCDIDILVNKKDFQEASKILLSMGYKKGEFSNHDQGFIKDPFNVELHYKLIDQKEYGGEYFKNPFSLMMKKEDSSEFVFAKKEDEYFYYLCHLLKHYEEYGIGFKHFLDLHLFGKNNNLDYSYIRKLYKKTSYEKDCLFLEEFTKELFSGDSKYNEIINDVINDKAYGTREKMMRKELENKSSFAWLLSKVFPNLKYMKNRYSILRYKLGYLLLPLLYFHHWINYGVFKLGYSIMKYKKAKNIKNN